MNAPGRFDVVVAGGGPAGATLACLLRARGFTVAVCDAARFPRDKICGEYVPPAAGSTFVRLGVHDEIAALARPHVGMAVISPDGTRVLGRYEGGAHGWSIRRRDLDRILLDAARRSGAVVREAARVTGLTRVPGAGYEVQVGRDTLRARVIVGADGRNSFVARRLGLRRAEGRHRKWAVMAHFAGVGERSDHGEMIVTPYGYCGVNPLPNGLANVAIVLERGDLQGHGGGRARLADYLRRRLDEHPRTRERIGTAPIAAGPWATGPLACRAARATDDAALLVGDAAGFYDPFTGEGIAMALRGAELAAEVLHEALVTGDTSRRALSRYDAARQRAFRNRLRLDRRLQSLLRHAWLTDRVARRLQRRPALADLLANVTGDTADAARVLGPRFLARLIGAWPGTGMGRVPDAVGPDATRRDARDAGAS